MPGLLSNVDPDGLLEYSVVFTDRALNHMSARFQAVMRDVARVLKTAYGARSAAIVPGSGTFGMEAVARQFATGKRCLVIRDGWFSYRWTQIFDTGHIPAAARVLKARPTESAAQPFFAPPPIGEVVKAIDEFKPDLVFAAHVETASGILLPKDYVQKLAAAVHAHGGMFVLDCIASGAMWVDMRNAGADILLSAPQKGWSAPACCGLVMLGEDARKRIDATTSTSFACNLREWLRVMEAYEGGHHAYYTTMPTTSITRMRDAMLETEQMGWDATRSAQQDLGGRVRTLLRERGFKSVAAPGFESPSVIVSYTTDDEIQSTRKFAQVGVQAAAGTPLAVDEPAGFKTFRIGLFGLEKLRNIDRAVANLAAALQRMQPAA